MATIVSVTFKNGVKPYYFDPGDMDIKTGQKVIVETARGIECGDVTEGRRQIADVQVPKQLKQVIRIATEDDLRRVEENARKETEAFAICTQKIISRGLNMKLVRVEYSFDGNKILFCFTADGRVDFRELVRDLAGVFHTRIELRQIGIRDEAKILGGLGICGRPFCCSTFIGDFQPVSIKMAKEQGLSLNPVKISGTCGRLMCCLKYEQKAYEDLIRNTPTMGSKVRTPEGVGIIVDVALLTGMVSVRLDSAPEGVPRSFNKRDVTTLDGGTFGRRDPDDLGDLDEELLEDLAKLEDEPDIDDRVVTARPNQNRPRFGNRGGQRKRSNNNDKPVQSQSDRPKPPPPKQAQSGHQPGQNPGSRPKPHNRKPRPRQSGGIGGNFHNTSGE